MDLYQLKMFFVLCQVQNYTETANRMCVTQSAISHAIKKLENSIDSQLIRKKGRQFALTDAGRELYASCQVIFSEVDKIAEDLKKYHSNAFYQITLGSPVEFGTTILIRHMQAFMENHPQIHVDFFFSHHLRDPLLRDEVDFIVDCHDHCLAGIEKIFLFQEHYVTIGSPEFIEKHNIRQIQDLRRIKILSLDKEAVWWANFIAALPEKRADIFGQILQINHVRGLINGAEAGLGIGFVPSYTVICQMQERILVDPFPEFQPLADHFNIFIKKEKMKLKKNQILIDYLKQVKPVEFGIVD